MNGFGAAGDDLSRARGLRVQISGNISDRDFARTGKRDVSLAYPSDRRVRGDGAEMEWPHRVANLSIADKIVDPNFRPAWHSDSHRKAAPVRHVREVEPVPPVPDLLVILPDN